MSMVMNFPPGVEMTLLSSILESIMSAVGVPTSHGKWTRFPPRTARVRFVSFSWSRTEHANVQYVTSLNLFAGTYCLSMK